MTPVLRHPLELRIIRDMTTRDLSQVLKVERNAQEMPWSRLSFEESLSKQHICRVVELEQQIIAFHVICPVADECHVLNVVVAPNWQGQGLGHVLMQDIIDHSYQQNSKRIFLEVRASNDTAQNLYQQWQFETLSIRKKYYRTASSEREDAIVLVKLLE